MSPIDGKRYTPDEANPPRRAAALPTEAELDARFRERILLFAARRLGDAAAAEDAVQETLRRVIEALRAGRVQEAAALPGFVFGTAMHVCQHWRRAAGREARAMLRLEAPAESEEDALVAIVAAEERDTVRRALVQLPEGDRELLRALYFEQEPTEALARRLGVTPVALRVRKHRALQRLAALLARGDA